MTIRSLVGESEGYGESRFSVIGANPNAAEGDFESIATVSLSSGTAATIQFTSIPATYRQLQLRMVMRSTYAITSYLMSISFNGDFSGLSYAYHYISGDGATISANAGWDGSYIATVFNDIPGANALASVFGASVIDIVDYANTSKYKTVRGTSGFDRNGAGVSGVWSGLYKSTSAISSVRLEAVGGSFAQYSHAALYGVKA